MSPDPHAGLRALRDAQARRFVERAGADEADSTELQALRAEQFAFENPDAIDVGQSAPHLGCPLDRQRDP